MSDISNTIDFKNSFFSRPLFDTPFPLQFCEQEKIARYMG